MRSLNYLKLTFLMILCLMIGCTKKKTEDDKYPSDQTLWVNWTTEPPTLDWNLNNDNISSNLALNLMEPLVGLHLTSPDLEAIPGLFTEWKHSKDFKKWTFQLRKNVRWTDGVTLTPQHVVDSFERLLNPQSAAQSAFYVFSIKNAKAYQTGELKDFAKVGIQILSPDRVEFTLESPLVFFPYVLTTANTLPIRKDLIEKFPDTWTQPQNLVTLGAYQLHEWRHDQRIVLKRNDNYFGRKAKIQYIAGRMIEDLTAAVKLFEAGKLDIHRGLTPADEQRYQNKPELVEQPSMAISYMNFNTRVAPFDSKKVRQMIVHSIDRQQVVSVLGPSRRLNTTWLPRQLLNNQNVPGLDFSPDKALKIFTTLDQKQQHDLQLAQLASNTTEVHMLMLQNIQSQLSKNLGLNLEIVSYEWKTYLRRLSSQAPPIFRLGYISSYPDPHFLMSLWTSDSDTNFTGWSSINYDKLVKKAAQEENQERRRELYLQAEKILVDEAPFFNIYTATNLSLVSSRVKNYIPNSSERLIFKDMEL